MVADGFAEATIAGGWWGSGGWFCRPYSRTTLGQQDRRRPCVRALGMPRGPDEAWRSGPQGGYIGVVIRRPGKDRRIRIIMKGALKRASSFRTC